VVKRDDSAKIETNSSQNVNVPPTDRMIMPSTAKKKKGAGTVERAVGMGSHLRVPYNLPTVSKRDSNTSLVELLKPRASHISMASESELNMDSLSP
jgi:hypothetical protein